MAAPVPEIRAPDALPPEPVVSMRPANEDPELRWLRDTYAGDNAVQLTFRAVAMGMVLGAVMAFSNLYVGLKTGWGLGVAITACIMSWAIFRALRPILGSEPSMLENNCMQSTASAAGYSTGATLVSAFSAFVMITGHHLPMGTVMIMVFFLAMLGVFTAIPMKRNMINIEQLPFPSGTAAAETLRSLYTEGDEAMKKAKSLFYAMGFGAVVGWFRDGMDMIGGRYHWPAWTGWITLPGTVPFDRFFTWLNMPRLAKLTSTSGYTFTVEASTIMMSAGAIMGIRVGASMLIGAVLSYGFLAHWAHNTPWGIPDHPYVLSVLGYRGIVSYTVWGGVSMMTAAALLNFGLQWKMIARAFSGLGAIFGKKPDAANDPLSRVEVPISWFLIGTGVSAAGCVAVLAYAFGISVFNGILAVAISFILAIVACRATGETDTTPIGPLGKITQLTYGVLIPANMTANLMTANVTSSIASASADLLTDLKSGYLLGANPRKQFWAQFSGVFMGTLVAVPAFYALVPDGKALGGDKFPAPAAQVWKAVAEVLAKGLHSMHSSTITAIAVGAVVGIVITLLEKALPNHKHLIPSPTGLGLAFTIPCWSAIAMFIGAFIAWVLEKRAPKIAEGYTVPVASGLIAGESLMGVAIALYGILADYMAMSPVVRWAVYLGFPGLVIAAIALFVIGAERNKRPAA